MGKRSGKSLGKNPGKNLAKIILAALLCALAAGNFLYGIVIWSIGSGTLFFAVWMVLGVLILLGGVLPLFVRKLKVLGRAFWVCGIIGLVCCLALTGAILRHFHDRADAGLDYVVVLGAQVFETEPSYVLKKRLDAAVSYLEESKDTVCIVSGGQGPNEPRREADVMKEYLVRNGIGEERILVEGESLTTVENFAYSFAKLNPETDRIGVVTNDFHLFRALGIAKKSGAVSVYGIAAGSHPYYLPNNLFRECLAIVKDALTGRMAWH